MTLKIGFILFPNLTQLDLTGPYEVLSHIPESQVHLIWREQGPVKADTGMQIVADTTFDACPQLDIVCVPGGPGQMDVMDDAEVLDFLRQQAKTAQYITSVCTGSLLLGAAGLLDGYKATTHWAAIDLLAAYGATYEKGRVVRDGNRVTAAGVSAGIDFALSLVAELKGEDFAKTLQLAIEYDPHPPFQSGHPECADPSITAVVRTFMKDALEKRQAQAKAYQDQKES